MEDVPVGGGQPKAGMMDEEFASSNNQVDTSGPLEERLANKNWGVRAAAFEELGLLFKGAQSSKDQVFSEHSVSWKKYLNDNNPGALEKCLDAMQAYIDLGDSKIIAVSQNDIIKALIEKCIGHAKPTIKQKGLECFNLLFEVTESFDECIETMTECLNHKTTKISQAAMVALNSWLANFGAKKVKIKSFLKIVENNANSATPGLRSEAMNFYKELYKWLGKDIKMFLGDLKKQQQDDLDKAFEELNDKPKTVRYTRTEQKKMKDSKLDDLIKQEEDSKQSDNLAYDLAEEVDILAKYGPEWQDKIQEMKKWNEKKEQLDQLINDCNVPKLKQDDYSGLVRTLKKLMGDANSVVSMQAIKASGCIAKALRSDFGEQNCKELLPALIGKFKEKKTQTIEDVHVVLEHFQNCTNLEAITPDIVAGISDKFPTVKRNMCLFLSKIVQVTYIDVLQRCCSDLIDALKKNSEDSSSEIRDAALSTMGIFKGRLGDSAMSKYLSDMNAQKLAKVNESAATVQPSKYDRPEKKAAPPPPQPKKASENKKQEESKKKKVEEEKKTAKKQVEKVEVSKKEDVEMKDESGDNNNQQITQTNDLDDKPLTGGGKATYDDMPIGGGKANNFDDMPIGGNKGSAFDEQPIGGNKGSTFDDMPIGGNKTSGFNAEDERPMGNKGGYNLDDIERQEQLFMEQTRKKKEQLLEFGDDKPATKRAPPKLGANRKAKEEIKNEDQNEETKIKEDVEMNSPKKGGGLVTFDDDQQMSKPPPPRKVPVKKEAPAKTTAAAKDKKGAAAGGGADGEDEGGSGLSKEEAIAKVEATFSAEHVAQFDSAQWKDQVEGFKGIAEQVVELQPGADVIEALAKFVKLKMKDWKVSNINLIKEILQLFLVVAQNSEKVNRRAVSTLMPFLSDKIGDVKTMTTVNEMLILYAELVTPKFVANQLVKYGLQAKDIKVLKETSNTLCVMTDEFGMAQMPLKEMINYANTGLGHSNPQVRTAAMALFAIMYKHIGEAIRGFLGDIKESTMKLVEEEFKKVTPLKKGEHQSKRGLRGEAAVEEKAAGGAGGGGGLDDLLPRQDISKMFTAKLWPMFKDKEWKVRKEAADKVEAILKEAKMRIQPVGLNELMDNIKQKMSDSNKAVLKVYVGLIGQLVEALGPNSKQYSKKLLPPLLANLADKATLVRQDTVACADKWAEHIGADQVINYMGPLVQQENPEMRGEVLTWIIKNKESLKTCDAKELVKPLVSCLLDKASSVRQNAELIITEIMPLTGYGPFQQVITDLPVSFQNTLKPILEKVKKNCGNLVESSVQQIQQQPQQKAQNNNNASLGGNNNNASIKSNEGTTTTANKVGIKQVAPQAKTGLGKGSQTSKDDGQPKNTFAEAAKKKQQAPQTTGSASKLGSSLRSDSKDTGNKLRSGNLGASINSFVEQNNNTSILDNLNVVPGQKERRAELDKKNKWQLEEIKGDQIEKLRQSCTPVFGQAMTQKMFSNDFKNHTEVIDAFGGVLRDQQSAELLKEILDLIFKWTFVKLADSTNMQFNVKVFDFFAELLRQLEAEEYQLYDFEALVIVPMLCDKTGCGNNIIKDKVKFLIKMIYPIYDKSKCYNMLITYGLNSKNMKAQAECLDELYEFIKAYGVDYTQEKELKMVAKMADSTSKDIRENALQLLSEVYKYVEGEIWRIIGTVTPKVQGLLEQRFKKVKPGTGLGSSNSQSDFQIQSQHQQASPRNSQAAANQPLKTQGSFGLKKQSTQGSSMMELQKKAITPRSNLNFQGPNKNNGSTDRPPTSFSNQVQQQNQSNLSRSINKFNQSNRSNEEQKQLGQSMNQSQQQQQLTQSSIGGINRLSQMRKMPSQDQSISHLQASNKIIPKTVRMDSNNQQDLYNQQDNNKSQLFKGPQPVELQRNTYSQGNVGPGGLNIKQNVQQNNLGGGGFISQDDDDVEDIRNILTNDLYVDQELNKQAEEINKHILQLKHGDLSKRVDSLVSLNDMISAIEVNKLALQRTANDLINAFTHVLIDIFEKPLEEIPLRFAKYFITIVLKACSCKEIMREASEESIFELAEQLLTRLLIENLDKVGENKEGELILKNLNSSMIRLLENCNHTYIFCVLFNLLRKYKDFHKMSKLPGLIIKCLLKLSKILEKLIDKLDMEKILLAIHEYLVVINHDNKTQNDEMGIRIVKTVTNELVKLKRESIWEAYRVIQCHSQPDHHIQRWIQIILKSLQGQPAPQSQSMNQSYQSNSQQVGNEPAEMRQLIDELKNSEMFENAIPKLHNYLVSHPQVDLNEYLAECSKTFADFIKKNLEKHRGTLREESKYDNSKNSTSNSDSQNIEQRQQAQTESAGRSGSISNTNRVQELQSKVTSFQQRYKQKTMASQEQDTQQNQARPQIQEKVQQTQQQQPQQQNLNTSFSDMNTRLTQKWNQINKKTSSGIGGGASQMSSTMGGFGSSNLERASVNMNQSSGGNGVGTEGNETGQNTKGASNSDLQQRLNDMKAKLTALKRNNKGDQTK